MSYKIPLRIVSSIVLDGIIVRPGTVADVDRAEAQRLLHRGKAELVTVSQVEPDPEGGTAEPEQVEHEPAPAKAKKGR